MDNYALKLVDQYVDSSIKTVAQMDASPKFLDSTKNA